MDREELKLELKKMVIFECQKELAPEDLADGEQLIGGPHDFDSLDALQIAMAVQQRYGKRIEGTGESRAALASINALADYILADS